MSYWQERIVRFMSYFSLLLFVHSPGVAQDLFSPYTSYHSNLHSHTTYSDGIFNIDWTISLVKPDPFMAYGEAQQIDDGLQRLDVLAVTDHAELLTPHAPVGELPLWEVAIKCWSSDDRAKEWDLLRIAALESSGSTFRGLRGFEWSADGGQRESDCKDQLGLSPLVYSASHENIGHINVIGTTDYVSHHYVGFDSPLDINHKPEWQKDTLDGLFDWVNSQSFIDPLMIAQFNHPNTYSGLPFVELHDYGSGIVPIGVFSHPPDERYPNVKKVFALIELSDETATPFLKPKFVAPEEYWKGNSNVSIWQQALKNGWQLAPALNEDNHAGNYGSKELRTGIWARSLDEDSILAAIQARRVYAAQDRTLELKFWLEDTNHQPLTIMGQTLSGFASQVVPRVDVTKNTHGISNVSLVTISRSQPIPGTGRGLPLGYDINNPERYTSDRPLTPDSSTICYYIRVELDNGGLAFSAPIWLKVYSSSEPSNLTATPGNSFVTLDWSPVEAATSYNIKRANISGSEVTVRTGVAVSNFTDSGLANGTTYFYRVSATTPAGETATSSEVSATPHTFAYTWTGFDGTSWFDPGNWTPFGVPQAGDTATISNGGTVDLTSGATVAELDLSSGVINSSGTLIADAFHWSGGRIQGDLNFTGVADCSGGTLSGSLTIPVGSSLTLSGGTLNGGGMIDGGGAVNWTGGAISGPFTIASDTSLSISGDADKTLARNFDGSISLTTNGSTTWSGRGNLILYQSDLINNGRFTAANDASIIPFENLAGVFGGTLVNHGTFVKSGTIGSTTVADRNSVTNDGTIDVQSGSLELDSPGGSSTGTIRVGPGSHARFSNLDGTWQISGTLDTPGGDVTFALGSFNFKPGATLTAGSLGRIPGQVHMFGTLALKGALELDPGGYIGDGVIAFTGSGAFNWKGGGMSATVTIPADGHLAISGNDDKRLDRNYNGPNTFTNGGTATWTGAGRIVIYFSDFNNTGSFLASNDSAIVPFNFVGNFNNSGSFSKNGTGGTTLVQDGVNFNNSGLLTIFSGALSLENGLTQTTGQTSLNGGDIVGDIRLQGGTLLGSGKISGNLTNQGIVAPGSSATTGILTITGNYTQSATGVLNVKVTGAGAGSQYDQLSVGRAASLSGTLNATLSSGYVPDPGKLFYVARYGSHTGSFSPFNGPFLTSYTDTSLALSALAPGSPAIDSFTPATGPVGTRVVINGHNFTSVSAVTIGGVSALFAVNTDSQISATVPAGAATGPIIVTNGVGPVVSGLPFVVTRGVPIFTIGRNGSCLSPASGKVGTYVTIRGQYFSGATRVSFGGKSAQFSVNSDSQITAIVPVGAATGTVSVTTPAGTGTSSFIFTVTP